MPEWYRLKSSLHLQCIYQNESTDCIHLLAEFIPAVEVLETVCKNPEEYLRSLAL